jgi:hypothetical protein
MIGSSTDPAAIARELDWLKANPDFEERPATIKEFVTAEYLNIESKMRKAIMDELETIIGPDVSSTKMTDYAEAMITGGIGIGKTTIASVVLPWLAHWVLCLRDPQDFFNLLPGSRIAFMQMSTSGNQAKEVVFGDIKARIQYSPWFAEKYPYDKDFKNQLRFPKDIWILPGDSAETTFEGYNILGGILDEADSHKVTKDKDYAEQGYTTIHSRIDSRFGAVERPDGTHSYGFLLVIGQMKKGNGFAAKKYQEFKKRPDRYAVRMAIWESFGWQRFLRADGTRDSFWYDSKRKEICPPGTVELLKAEGKGDHLIEVPEAFRSDFENNPEKALRDLAGIPPATGSPFISLVYKIEDARDRWIERFGDRGPVDGVRGNMIAKWFRAQESLKRVAHIDLAYSAEGDALGFAMGHIPEMVVIEGERKPFIVIDMIMRVAAPSGTEIFLGDIRRMIYDLKADHGFNIKKVTMDGFQSTDTRQQLEKRRYETELVSVDKTILPYHDLREAIYENRIAFPPYAVRLRVDDPEPTEILVKELVELMDNGDKIDHPPEGSKDISDAVAGVCFTLMGARHYHRNVVNMEHFVSEREKATGTSGGSLGQHPALRGLDGLRAPVPPRMGDGTGVWRPPRRRP